MNLGSHTLDLLDLLVGPITDAAGMATNQGGRYAADDTVAATVTFGSGVLGAGLWDFDAHDHLDEVEIVGPEGTLRFSTFDPEPLRLTTSTSVREIAAPYPSTAQLPLIQTVVDALTGRGECPSTGRSALRTARAVDSILASYRAAEADAETARLL